MSRKSIPIVLTKAEVNRLKQWIRAGSTPQQVVLRARIIEAAAGARQDREIAAQLHVHRRTVALWRCRAREQGIGCVWEIASGRGRKTPYAAAVVDRLGEATLQTKPAGSRPWRTPSLARTQGVSKNTVHRIWQEHQIKPHLIKTFKLSRDPKFLEKLTDVVGVYLTPPQNAMVLCVDEKSQIQALDRTQPGLPLKKGRAAPSPMTMNDTVRRRFLLRFRSSQDASSENVTLATDTRSSSSFCAAWMRSFLAR